LAKLEGFVASLLRRFVTAGFSHGAFFVAAGFTPPGGEINSPLHASAGASIELSVMCAFPRPHPNPVLSTPYRGLRAGAPAFQTDPALYHRERVPEVRRRVRGLFL
jgi:hypothetical protein